LSSRQIAGCFFAEPAAKGLRVALILAMINASVRIDIIDNNLKVGIIALRRYANMQ
jgi:hypothetical protein